MLLGGLQFLKWSSYLPNEVKQVKYSYENYRHPGQQPTWGDLWLYTREEAQGNEVG